MIDGDNGAKLLSMVDDDDSTVLLLMPLKIDGDKGALSLLMLMAMTAHSFCK